MLLLFARSSPSLLLLPLLLLLLPSPASSSSVSSRACVAETEFFDTGHVDCRLCAEDIVDANKVPDRSVLGPTGDALSCRCKVGFRSIKATCDQQTTPDYCLGFVCESCVLKGLASTADGASCMACSTTEAAASAAAEIAAGNATAGNTTAGNTTVTTLTGATLNVLTGDCACAGNARLVERDGVTGLLLPHKACVACPANTKVDALLDPYTCVRDATKPCDDGFVEVGKAPLLTCIPEQQNRKIRAGSSAARMEYYSVQEKPGDDAKGTVTLQSATFLQLFQANAARCYFYRSAKDLEACQVIGNLCALSQYDTKSAACSTFDEIWRARNSISHDIQRWHRTLPWLEYGNVDSNLAISSVAIESKVRTTPGAVVGVGVGGLWVRL